MSDHNQTVNNKDQTALLTHLDSNGLPERLWTYDDFMATEDRPAGFATGLVSLAFIKAALRRGIRFCCAMAVMGLLVGCGLDLAFPPSYQASTSILLTFGPYENPTTAAADDQVMAQSHAVARLAVQRLGMSESASAFAAVYTAAPVSDRVLVITTNAPSSSQAVTWANAVAAAFLRFHASQLDTEQALVLNSLEQQVSQARQRLNSISKQISQLPARPTSPAQITQLNRLQTERNQISGSLYTLEQSANGTQVKAATALAAKGTVVLDSATPIPHSKLKRLLLYPVAGLILGFALGVGIVVVKALVSDRLRRRDDVAQALGAPVKVSVGDMKRSRWLPGRRGHATARDTDIRRIVTFLRSAAQSSFRGAAALAVVPIDDQQAAAQSVVSLAVSCAQEGKQVVVADLCHGAPAATLLGAAKAGVHPVSMSGAHMVAAVPDRDDVAPVGPLDPARARTQRSPFAEAAASACMSADLVLTLAALDPALGGDYLATWATDAVAVVTAGKSSASRIHAVGEMIRLIGIRLAGAVLVGADKTDESLGRNVDEEGSTVTTNKGSLA